MVDYRKLAVSADALANDVRGGRVIPYAEMDCQELCEYLLMECGMDKSAVNLAGSNAHYRKLRWSGTLDEAIALFGKIPEYCWLFILEEGVQPKRYNDSIGDAGHMGQYLKDMQCIHSSASEDQIVASEVSLRLASRGSWNRVGLNAWTCYADDVEQILDGIGEETDSDVEDELKYASEAILTPTLPKAQFAVVVPPPGSSTVNLRAKPSKSEKLYWTRYQGDVVQVARVQPDGWVKVKSRSRTGYIRGEYLKMLEE